jgi:hypothetical protein
MNLEVLCTAVSERADLFVETMASMLAHLETPPGRLIVHEDVRPGSAPGAIGSWLAACGISHEHKITAPARGLGPAMRWCFEQTTQPIVFYTQEDWRFVRPLPLARCVEIMERHGLHHVRFNKRKTLRAKHQDTPHPWHKMEVSFDDAQGEVQTFCVSDHWYTQASLWRVDAVRAALAATAEKDPQANAFVAALNHWLNLKYIGDPRCVQDQKTRHARMRTYIWGPVGEPAFIQHLGSVRTTGPIEHVSEIRRRS